jgi:hypothetical protein
MWQEYRLAPKLKSILDTDREMINSPSDNNNRSFHVFTYRCGEVPEVKAVHCQCLENAISWNEGETYLG